MAEDGKIVYKVKIDDSGVETEAQQAGTRAGDSFGKGAGTFEEVWTGAARRIGEAFVNMALNAARKAGQLIRGSIETGMEFDSAMSQVAATLGYTTDELNDSTTEAAKNFSDLEEFALEMGRTTAFTATEAAEALNYMALAGYDAETSMRMLPTVLNLAAAGAMDLGKASDAVTDIQSALGLSIEETETLVDQMARTAQRTNTSVSQLAEGMLQVGGNARYLSGGTAELSEILGIMASAGIKGAEGGTHLRNMILRLASPTDDGITALENLGVSIFDAEGKMRSFAAFMPEIARALEDLSDEEKLQFFDTVFNVRDIAAANALMNTSVEEWARLATEIQNSEGAAEGMATTQLDNLKGDITLLKSAWEGFQIELANKFEPVLREIMPRLIELVGRLTESLINADWSKLGDAIVNIAEKAIEFLEYLINHGDEVIRIVETIGAVLLSGKISSLFGGSGAGGLVSGAVKGGSALVSTVAANSGAIATGAAGAAGAALPLSLIWGLGMGVSDYFGARKAALANATIGTDASVAEAEANVARLQAAVDEATAYYNSRQFELYATESEDGWHLSEAIANLDAAKAALAEGEAELETIKANAEANGQETAENFAAGLEKGAGTIVTAAAGIAASVASVLSGRASVESAVGGLLLGGLASTITVPVSINGREVARATAYDMSEQMAWDE